MGFDSLDNGFLASADPTPPARSATNSGRPTCRRSSTGGPRGCRGRCRGDRAAGCQHRLRTCKWRSASPRSSTRRLQGRHFFEAVIRENLDLGRPDRIGLLSPGGSPAAPGPRARLPDAGHHRRGRAQPPRRVQASDVKQYFKEQRALRTETTINNPNDFAVTKALANLTHCETTVIKSTASSRKSSASASVRVDPGRPRPIPTPRAGRPGTRPPPCASATHASSRSSKPSGLCPSPRRLPQPRPPSHGRGPARAASYSTRR